MSSSMTLATLLPLLSLLPPRDDLPPASAHPTALPKADKLASTAARHDLRNAVLLYLSRVLKPDLNSPLICPRYPTPQEERAFVARCAGWAEGVRKRAALDAGLSPEQQLEADCWREVHGSVRKSDLADARGTRYDQLVLALACQAVVVVQNRRSNLAPTASASPLADLQKWRDYYTQAVVQAADELPMDQLDALAAVEARWAAVHARRGQTRSSTSPSSPAGLETIAQLKQARDRKLADLRTRLANKDGANTLTPNLEDLIKRASTSTTRSEGHLFKRVSVTASARPTLFTTAVLLTERLAALDRRLETVALRLSLAEAGEAGGDDRASQAASTPSPTTLRL